MISIICCCFISSCSVSSSCLLCRRCKLYSLNKEKIIAQQSPHHFLILYLLFCLFSSTPRAHLCLKMSLPCSLRHCTCPGLPPQFSQPTSSTATLGLSFISSADHPGTFFFLVGCSSFHFATFVHLPPTQVLVAWHPTFRSLLPSFFFQLGAILCVQHPHRKPSSESFFDII